MYIHVWPTNNESQSIEIGKR